MKKNRNCLLGILVIVLVFGVMVVGCDEDSKSGDKWEKYIDYFDGELSLDRKTITYDYDGGGTISRATGGDSLNGVWTGLHDSSNNVKVTISGNKNWVVAILSGGKYYDFAKGTFTLTGNDLEIKMTHINPDFF